MMRPPYMPVPEGPAVQEYVVYAGDASVGVPVCASVCVFLCALCVERVDLWHIWVSVATAVVRILSRPPSSYAYTTLLKPHVYSL